MPYHVLRFDPTPNPNALKCVLDRAIVAPDEAPRSYRSSPDASEDPVAAALFAIAPAGSVTSVLINADWITINKTSEADWKPIKDAVRDVLAKV